MNFYNDRVCLNVLAGSIDNAKEIYEVTEGHVIVGLLSKNYSTLEEATQVMNAYAQELDNNISVGLGAGDPKQCVMVAELAKTVHAKHFNQVFTAVGHTRANAQNDDVFINALVKPTETLGKVVISTGPLSEKEAVQAEIDVDTAIAMVKDMGGNSLKVFPIKGLEYINQLKFIAERCAKHNFNIEPTGGIDLDNFEEIVQVCLDAGVPKIIPHVYSSIMEDGETKVKDVKKLYKIIQDIA